MLSLIATVIVLLAFGGITVFADETEPSVPEIIARGFCGVEGNENISWTLDSDGLMTISGTGEMEDTLPDIDTTWATYKNKVKKVVITEGVTCIGSGDFSGFLALESIDIPDSVTSIGSAAFHECLELSEITLPNNVGIIEANTFSSCSSLVSCSLPDNLTTICDRAFEGCSSLTSVVIPDSVTIISTYAFFDCGMLETLYLPGSIKSIGDFAFYGCSLGEIHLNCNPDVFNNDLTNVFVTNISSNVYIPNNYVDRYAYLFKGFGGVTLYRADGTKIDATILYGYKLILDGCIGVDFYVKLSQEVLIHSSTAFNR